MNARIDHLLSAALRGDMAAWPGGVEADAVCEQIFLSRNRRAYRREGQQPRRSARGGNGAGAIPSDRQCDVGIAAQGGTVTDTRRFRRRVHRHVGAEGQRPCL